MISLSNSRQLTVNFIAQVVAFLVNLAIGFLVTPYIVSKLGVDSYGFVGLANDFVGYAQIITVALNSMATRFITVKLYENKIDDANKLFNSILFTNIIMSTFLFIIGTFIIIFMDKIITVPSGIISDVRILWLMIFTSFIMTTIMSVFSAATFIKNKLYLASINQIFAQIARVVVLFGALYFFKPSVWYIGISTLVYSLITIIYNFKFTKELLTEITISIKYFDIKCLFEVISSGIWNTITKISGLLSNGLDLLITNKFINASFMGIVAMSKSIPSIIITLFGMLATIFAPQLVINYARKEYEEMKNSLIFSIKLLGIFSPIPLVILFCYGIDFYTLWAPSQNALLLQNLTLLSCMAMTLSLPLEPLWNIFSTTNKVKQSSIFLIICSFITIIIVFIGLNFANTVDMKLYIIVGVSAAMALFKSGLFLPLYGAKLLNIKLTTFYPVLIKNLIAIVLGIIFTTVMKTYIASNTWLMLFVSAMLCAIIVFIIDIFTVLDKNDRGKVANSLKKKFVNKFCR